MPEAAVRIDILLDEERDAEKRLKSVERQSKRTFRSFEKDAKRGAKAGGRFGKVLGGLKGQFLALAGGIGLAAITRTAVQSWITQEKAVMRLDAALMATGNSYRFVREELAGVASEVQKFSVYGDEAVLSGMALARSMGATIVQMKEMARLAPDLATGMGVDLNTAFRQMAVTLGGMSGELGEKLPGIRRLTIQQRMAGGAMGVIRERFGGMAARVAESDSGRLQQALNTLGDHMETLGSVILPALNRVLGGFTAFVTEHFPSQAKVAERIEPYPDKYTDLPLGTIMWNALVKGGEGPAKAANAAAVRAQEHRDMLAAWDRMHGSTDAIYTDQFEKVVGLNTRLGRVGARQIPVPSLQSLIDGLGLENMTGPVSLEGTRSAYAGAIRGAGISGVGGMSDLLDKIEQSKASIDAAKSLFAEINAPTAEEVYQQRLAGLQAGYNLYNARLGVGAAPGSVVGSQRAAAKYEGAASDLRLNETYRTRPLVGAAADDLRIAFRTSTADGIREGLLSGDIRSAFETLALSFADSMVDALSMRLAEGLVERVGIDQGIDSILNLIGPASSGAE